LAKPDYQTVYKLGRFNFVNLQLEKPFSWTFVIFGPKTDLILEFENIFSETIFKFSAMRNKNSELANFS
jgi:hypothetical protein